MNVYVAELGESLFNIADMYNVDIQDMIAANPHIWDPKYTAAGEQVIIPPTQKTPEAFGCVPGGMPLQPVVTDQPCPEGLSNRKEDAEAFRHDPSTIIHTSWDVDEEKILQITKQPYQEPVMQAMPLPQAQKQHLQQYTQPQTMPFPSYPMQGYHHWPQQHLPHYPSGPYAQPVQHYHPQAYSLKR